MPDEIIYRGAWIIRTRCFLRFFWLSTVISPYGVIMEYEPIRFSRRTAVRSAQRIVDRTVAQHFPDEQYPPVIGRSLKPGQTRDVIFTMDVGGRQINNPRKIA